MRALALLALLAGLGFLALGAHIALFGSERPLAHDATRLEGKVLPGRSTDSPAGEPFLYGRVRIRSANRDGKSLMHVDRTFGDPGVRVETEGGTRTVRLPAPDEWRVTRDHDDIGTIPSLHDIPLLAAEDVRRLGETIPPPYEVNVRAIRADNHIVGRVGEGGALARVAIGDPGMLERDRLSQDRTRWPIVFLLFLVGAASCAAGVAAYRSARARR